MEGTIRNGKSKDIGNWACKIQNEDKQYLQKNTTQKTKRMSNTYRGWNKVFVSTRTGGETRYSYQHGPRVNQGTRINTDQRWTKVLVLTRTGGESRYSYQHGPGVNQGIRINTDRGWIKALISTRTGGEPRYSYQHGPGVKPRYSYQITIVIHIVKTCKSLGGDRGKKTSK